MPLMPTSAPSATIGGFVGQGGAGIGSAAAGTLADNLVSVTAVLGDGSLRTFEGDEVALVYGMEGITGIVTAVTFRMLPAGEETVAAFSFADAAAAQAFARAAQRAGAWHVNIQPPNYVALMSRATGAALPENWIVLAVTADVDGLGAAAAAGAGAGVLSPMDLQMALIAMHRRMMQIRPKKTTPIPIRMTNGMDGSIRCFLLLLQMCAEP